MPLRSQNPPQANIEKAKQIERYLQRRFIGTVYASLGIVYALLVSAIFWGLIHASLLKGGRVIVSVVVAIALVPAAMVFLGYFVSPNDPISNWLLKIAGKWRQPLDTTSELYTFRELMLGGETTCIKISFYLPVENHTDVVKERLYNYVHGVLGRECGARTEPPSLREVQNLIDAPMEILASEFDVPVLFSEVHEVYLMQAMLDFPAIKGSGRYWTGIGA